MRQTLVLVLLIAAVTSGMFSTLAVSTVGASGKRAVLVEIRSSVDHWAAELVDDAVKEADSGRADTVLVILDAPSGYFYPSMRIVRSLTSCKGNVIVYVGPQGATALSYGAFVALAGTTLAMHEGTSIGRAMPNSETYDIATYLLKTAKELAKEKGRNALAVEAMVTGNAQYSADEAYDNGISELTVASYSALLKWAGINDSDTIRKDRNIQSSFDRERAADLLRLFADPNTVKYLFLLLSFLVVMRLGFVFTRSRSKDGVIDVQKTMLNLMKMEIQDLSLAGATRENAPPITYATALHTSPDISYVPTRRKENGSSPAYGLRTTKR